MTTSVAVDAPVEERPIFPNLEWMDEDEWANPNPVPHEAVEEEED